MTDEKRYQYVDCTGKPDWCPAMIFAEVWDGDEKPVACHKLGVAWAGPGFVDYTGALWANASPVLKPEPKPRLLVWWWNTKAEYLRCDLDTFCWAQDQGHSYIPARIIDGELEPTPTVAEARARKEAEL
jgi:hypothetical protein